MLLILFAVFTEVFEPFMWGETRIAEPSFISLSELFEHINNASDRLSELQLNKASRIKAKTRSQLMLIDY
jgi:hypothetical protein